MKKASGRAGFMAVGLVGAMVMSSNVSIPKTFLHQGQLTDAYLRHEVSKPSAPATRLPLRFELNRGQFDESVKYVVRSSGYSLFLTGTEAIFKFSGSASGNRAHGAWRGPNAAGRGVASRRPSILRMQFPGSSPVLNITGSGPVGGVTNYFHGRDPGNWLTNIPSYSKVTYKNLYEGIDLVFYGTKKGDLEYDFVVKPGADPKQVAVRFEGAKSLALTKGGALEIGASRANLIHKKPFVYQKSALGRHQVKGGYLLDQNEIRFDVGRYEPTKTLIIDPVIEYSSFLGGSRNDEIASTAVDSSGSAYVVGTTDSSDFPLEAPVQAGNSSDDVFISKLLPDGSGLVYSSYLGGTNPDLGSDVAVDSSGVAYLTGITYSNDFPVLNPFQGSFAGDGDFFVAKLTSEGGLGYSSFLGGTAAEGIDEGGDSSGPSIAVDGSLAVYVTGSTASTDFPAVLPLQAASAGDLDAVVSKVAASGLYLDYSSYLGGAGPDFGGAIAVDAAGAAYVTGTTYSPDFPTANAFDPSKNGLVDAFVSKISPSGSSLSFSTFLGGPGVALATGVNAGKGIAVDSSNHAFVTGFTTSLDFPTVNPARPAGNTALFCGNPSSGTLSGAVSGACGDGFLTRFSEDGASLSYSTYLGGRHLDFGLDVALANGEAVVVGATRSLDFPTQHALQPRLAGSFDLFVTRLTTSGNDLIYSTYLGGRENDSGVTSGDETFLFRAGVAVDSAGNAYVAGTSRSQQMPLANPLQEANRGGRHDGFFLKIGSRGAGDWKAAGNLNVPRFGHTATLLTDGRVLAAGGCAVPSDNQINLCPAHTPAAEVFSASSGKWQATAPMAVPRAGHSATLLSNGKVLVTGGCSGSDIDSCSPTASAELFDPSAGVWLPTGPMASGRRFHTSSLLPNGKVLVSGGEGEVSSLSSGELYDPVTGLFSPAGPLSTARSAHTATMLPNGNVLMVGGKNEGSVYATAELYHQASNSFLPTGSLTEGRAAHTATLLASGKVLVAAGASGTSSTSAALRTAELYDPATGSFSPAQSMAERRSGHGATLLADGSVLIAGGRSYLDSTGFPPRVTAELFNAQDGSWRPAESMLEARSSRPVDLFFDPRGHTLTLLKDDCGPAAAKVLAVGGSSAALTELYTPAHPLVGKVFPRRGSTSGGTSVSITGRGFSGATAINFGSTSASSFNVVSDSQVNVISPPGAIGRVPVRVEANGTSPDNQCDHFTYRP